MNSTGPLKCRRFGSGMRDGGTWNVGDIVGSETDASLGCRVKKDEKNAAAWLCCT
jgi:hypothetical protein